MSLIAIVGQFDIHPKDAVSAEDLTRVMMNETIKDQGCRRYAYLRDLSTPNRFQLSELWKDDAALAAHCRADYTVTYHAGMSRLAFKAER